MNGEQGWWVSWQYRYPAGRSRHYRHDMGFMERKEEPFEKKQESTAHQSKSRFRLGILYQRGSCLLSTWCIDGEGSEPRKYSWNVRGKNKKNRYEVRNDSKTTGLRGAERSEGLGGGAVSAMLCVGVGLGAGDHERPPPVSPLQFSDLDPSSAIVLEDER